MPCLGRTRASSRRLWTERIAGVTNSDPALVPELLVTHTPTSLELWCGLCGFTIDYQRQDEGFAYISRGSAHVVLEQQGVSRNWITAPLERSLGQATHRPVRGHAVTRGTY